MTADIAPATAREETPLYRAESMLRERLAWYPRDGSTHWQHCEGEHWQCATALVLDELERLRALLTPPSETREIDRIAKFLNLERERGSWWLPAEPGPIECQSIAEAVEQFARICDNDIRRETREIERLRAALAGLLVLPPTFRDYTGTDYDTCGYCHEPIEDAHHSHADDCPWLLASRALTATPEDRNEM